MKNIGTVIKVEDKKAMVRFKRTDACGHCNACFHLGSNEADIEIDNTLKAAAGDQVVIELHGKSVFKASLIMYGVPIIGLIVGAGIGSTIGDLYAAVGGVLLAFGAFFIIRAFEPKLSKLTEYKPRMTGFYQEDDADKPNERENMF